MEPEVYTGFLLLGHRARLTADPTSCWSVLRSLRKLEMEEEEECSVLLVEGNTQQCSHITAAGHRTRAARAASAVHVAASMLPAQPDSSQPCSPLGSHCGAQQAQSKTQNCSAQCMLRLNFDRRGHSFDVHQQLLAGDSKKLLFASEKQSKISLHQTVGEQAEWAVPAISIPLCFPFLFSLILLLSCFEL